MRDGEPGGLRLRPPALRRPRLAVLCLPAAAHAGAAGADRAQPRDGGRSRPLRFTARRDGALLCLGLRHLPDAPDLPRLAARLRGGGRHRRRPVVGDRLVRAAAHGQAWPGGLRHRLGPRPLERVPVAPDGDQLSRPPDAHHRPCRLHARRRGRQGMGRAGGRYAAGHGAAGGGLHRLPATLRRQLRVQWSERLGGTTMTMIGRLGAGAMALALATAALPAWAQTKIDFFFPVPVEGKLAREMTRLVKLYNESQKEVEIVASYTGGYDDTKLK